LAKKKEVYVKDIIPIWYMGCKFGVMKLGLVGIAQENGATIPKGEHNV
jgi:hypothetical protein